MVQGVHGGPAAVFVAAFGGVQPLQQGALAPCLDFGGEPDEAEEGSGPADGAFTAPGGRGHALLGAALSEQGSAVAAGGEVCRGRVRGSHRQDSRQRDTATGCGDELVAHQQVMPAVDPLDVLDPPSGGTPARHTCVRARRDRAAQQGPRRHRTRSVPATLRPRDGSAAAKGPFPPLSDTRGGCI